MSKVHDMNWTGYLKTISLGGGWKSSCARVVMQLGCESACRAREKIQGMFARGEIDEPTYTNYNDNIDTLVAMYNKGEQTHVIDANKQSGWLEFRHGAHIRDRHIERDHGILFA